jgi:N-acetylmuramoyl-L-alanine amidase
MHRPLRAASFAAATFFAIFGAFYAGPTWAWETTAAPLAPSHLETTGTPVEADELSLNDVLSHTSAAPAAAAVADHVDATLPEAAEQVAAEQMTEPARRTLAELVADHGAAVTRNAEHECLAGAVYFESKGEPLQGQLTVAEVVLNRARSGRFPTSVCGVVKQKGQFSFIRHGGFPPIARGSDAWRKAVAIAHIAMQDLADGAAPKALFFHARYVRPSWRGLTRVAAVGNHIFYR